MRLGQSLPGWREMDLLRRLRDAFTKTPLNYRPSEPRNVRLREEIIKHFALPAVDVFQDEIPTPIDNVLELIFTRCREYASAYAAAHNNAVQRTPAGDEPGGGMASGRR